MSEGVVREEAGKVVAGGFVAPTIGALEQALYFTTAPSVTEKAMQVLDQGRLRVPGAVVVWDETIGRRKGSKAIPNSWWADAGSLTVAFALPQQSDLSEEERLARIAAAVLRVAAAFRPRATVSLQSPNDLLIDGRKFGAVFCEPYGDVDLAVVRLNCRTDLQKAPPLIAGNAARLIDFIDVQQLPLQKEATLANTFLTRLMKVLPTEFSGG
jgi:hypothetical protein